MWNIVPATRLMESTLFVIEKPIPRRKAFAWLYRILETKNMIKHFLIPLLLISASAGFGQTSDHKWRAAAEKELKSLIPSRVTVENERIETEFRTASGVTDGSGKFIAGVVLITAGYSAEGKYTHFFVTQVALRCGDFELRPGEYVFGSKRTGDHDSLEVKFYEAATGKHIGDVKARLDPKRGPVRSLTITPPGTEKPVIKIGRFFFEYSIAG